MQEVCTHIELAVFISDTLTSEGVTHKGCRIMQLADFSPPSPLPLNLHKTKQFTLSCTHMHPLRPMSAWVGTTMITKV